MNVLSNGLPAWDNNIDSHWFVHNFLFFSISTYLMSYFMIWNTQMVPLVMSQNFYAQIQGLEQQQTGVSFLLSKKQHVSIFTH